MLSILIFAGVFALTVVACVKRERTAVILSGVANMLRKDSSPSTPSYSRVPTYDSGGNI